jgi:shikimate kinase
MRNIILIGMPGCGKSTIGVVLAKTAGKNFIDTDILIQESQGDLLQNIIDKCGIDYFKRIEEKVLSELQVENCVIATGGSAVYYESAMTNLKGHGLLVYLKLTFETIESRLNNIKTRGIVLEAGQTLKGLYNERIPLYEKYANVVIDGEGKDVEQIVAEIVDLSCEPAIRGSNLEGHQI